MKNHFNAIMGKDNMPEYISAISASQCARIRIDDIEVLEQEGRKLHVITSGNEYCFYGSLKDIIPLLAGRAFYRPIKGLIINFDHVRSITGNTVNFVSGQGATMGKNNITRTKAAYKKYLLRYPPYSLWEPRPHATVWGSEMQQIIAAPLDDEDQHQEDDTGADKAKLKMAQLSPRVAEGDPMEHIAVVARKGTVPLDPATRATV